MTKKNTQFHCHSNHVDENGNVQTDYNMGAMIQTDTDTGEVIYKTYNEDTRLYDVVDEKDFILYIGDTGICPFFKKGQLIK